MSKSVSRILWIIAGALLVVCGVICLIQTQRSACHHRSVSGPDTMLVSGIINIVIFVKGHDHMYGSGWFLVEGILAVVFAFFVLFNQSFTMLTLPFIFGMWLLFSGISKVVNSFDLKAFGVPGWAWFPALGILFTIVGAISFMNPVARALTLGSLIGVILILQGFGSILRALFSGRFYN